MDNPQEKLKNLSPTKEFFVGIDSDGCVFDTMEIKHKECFCPNTIKHWDLQMISKYVREAWDFVNLYSKTRGCNRFLALLEVMKLLSERVEVKNRGAKIPDMSELIEWTKVETKLGNPTLSTLVKEKPTPFLERLLKWSLSINETITDMVYGVPPFPLVRESLEKMDSKADMIVVSQTPVEALEREWEEHNIDSFARIIAGQEYGTKTEHLTLAAKDKYPNNKILMIGDAPGDMKAAKANGVLFYPINPGHEEASWERFHKEAIDKFFACEYEGDYEKSLIEEFDKYLPQTPPWK